MLKSKIMTDINKTEEAIAKMRGLSLGDVKILMVEDDTVFSDLVLEKLAKEGCIPYSCATGEEAVGLAEHYRPDIIILDLMLPGVQGEEILVELKGHPELKATPVIVVSNKSEPEDIQKVLDSGADEYLIKASTDLNFIVETINTVLRRV